MLARELVRAAPGFILDWRVVACLGADRAQRQVDRLSLGQRRRLVCAAQRARVALPLLAPFARFYNARANHTRGVRCLHLYVYGGGSSPTGNINLLALL